MDTSQTEVENALRTKQFGSLTPGDWTRIIISLAAEDVAASYHPVPEWTREVQSICVSSCLGLEPGGGALVIKAAQAFRNAPNEAKARLRKGAKAVINDTRTFQTKHTRDEEAAALIRAATIIIQAL